MLEPLIPPAALKSRILGRLAEIDDTSESDLPADEPIAEPTPAPLGKADPERESRPQPTVKPGHPPSRTERVRALVKRRPRWSFPVDRALDIVHGLASGCALVLLVLVAISAVRLMRTQERVVTARRAVQAHRERMEVAHRSTAVARQRLAELEAREPQLQAARRRADAETMAMATANDLLQRRNTELQQELEALGLALRLTALAEEQSHEREASARKAAAEIEQSLAEMRRSLEQDKAQAMHLEERRDVVATRLK